MSNGQWRNSYRFQVTGYREKPENVNQQRSAAADETANQTKELGTKHWKLVTGNWHPCNLKHVTCNCKPAASYYLCGQF